MSFPETAPEAEPSLFPEDGIDSLRFAVVDLETRNVRPGPGAVIEVGIDVPNANLIVIENAECFGLSQLHQLRGRTGRGSEKSYCILISDAKGEKAQQRFRVMTETNDGFKIAETDLQLRGPGDFFGARQSGLPTLRIADLLTDSRVMYAAGRDAKRILAQDPYLSAPEHENLRRGVEKLFADIS